MSQTPFSEQEFLRYTRHIQLPGVGVDGQQKLKQAHVVIVGCGGLGAPVSYYLAAAGVGNITLVDDDSVDLTNLQRQIIYSEDDLGQSKAQCAKRKLQALNSDINITAIDDAFHTGNAEQLVENASLVLDCSDNFATRYLINDVCRHLNTHWIYASIYQYSGQCALFSPQGSCFRCIFPQAPQDAPDCNAAGVLGVLPGLLGTVQATEALKFLLDRPLAIANTLLLVEADDMLFQKMAIKQNSRCLCHQDAFVFDPYRPEYQVASQVCAAEHDNQTQDNGIAACDFQQWAARDDVVVIDVREPNEHNAFNLGGDNIPLAALERLSAQNYPDKTLLLYCQSGVRSQRGCAQLDEKNIKAVSISGGINQILKQSQK